MVAGENEVMDSVAAERISACDEAALGVFPKEGGDQRKGTEAYSEMDCEATFRVRVVDIGVSGGEEDANYFGSLVG